MRVLALISLASLASTACRGEDDFTSHQNQSQTQTVIVKTVPANQPVNVTTANSETR